MISTDEMQAVVAAGGSVVGEDGDRVGRVEQVYLDDVTGDPQWVTVRTGDREPAFVPLAAASLHGEEIQVPYSRTAVERAPRVAGSDAHLDPAQEDELYRYYGVAPDGGPEPTSGPAAPGTQPAGDGWVTRSKEQLRAGTERVAVRRARLRKVVVTEERSVTVPVRHEELRIEEVPLDETSVSPSADEGGEAWSVDMVLSEERIVVATETVPVERVRVHVETVTEEQTVTGEVRTEHVDVSEASPTRTAG